MPFATAQVLTRAIVKYVADWKASAARKSEEVKPRGHLRSVM